MRKINLKEVPEQERKSPKGKFGRFSKNISIALGREPESLDLSKRHPFDLALVRIPKDKTLCPYHAHAAESELYLVVSGRGSVRDKDAIKEDPWQSPGEKYAVCFKGISKALGRQPASLDLSKRHPFDLEWSRVPPGKPNFPYHAHSAQWELYLVVSGKGTVRHKDGRTEV